MILLMLAGPAGAQSAPPAKPAPATAPQAPKAAEPPATTSVMLVPPAPTAPRETLAQVELRVGYGLSLSGSGATMSKRTSPLTLTALVDWKLQDEPPLWAYGGLLAETLDRSSVGGVFGVKYTPAGSRLHFAGGGSVIVAPDSLYGASVNGGYCRPQLATLGICGDLQLTTYFAGGDLGGNRAVTQIQLVIGAVLDVL